jgi:hypothetical protein
LCGKVPNLDDAASPASRGMPMSPFSRWRVLQIMLGTGMVAASVGAASVDEYPSRLIRLVIPYAGPLDVAGWS